MDLEWFRWTLWYKGKLRFYLRTEFLTIISLRFYIYFYLRDYLLFFLISIGEKSTWIAWFSTKLSHGTLVREPFQTNDRLRSVSPEIPLIFILYELLFFNYVLEFLKYSLLRVNLSIQPQLTAQRIFYFRR